MSRTFAGVIAVVLLTAAGPNGQTAAPAQGIRELTTALASADPVARARAACGLRDLGDGAAAAIDPLVRMLPDGAPVDATVCGTRWSSFGPDNLSSPGELAAGALAAIGSRAFAPVFAALKHDSWIARRNAAWTLGAIDDRRAVPGLSQALRDADDKVRSQAAWALGAIDDDAAVDPLVKALGDQTPKVREQAAWALGAIGDGRAMPGLLAALKDSHVSVRRQAAWAIGVIGR